MSKAHIIVGMTGTGKSYYLKKRLKKVPNRGSFYIFDYQNEYKEFIDYGLIPYEEFAYNCTLISNAVIVFEEASIFMGGHMKSTDSYVNEVLVSKRHKNNFVFLVFHAVAEIPPYIYRKCNYITIFKTNDLPDMSARELRDHRIKDYMSRVNANKKPHYSETMKII
jgi:hypothetical protein